MDLEDKLKKQIKTTLSTSDNASPSAPNSNLPVRLIQSYQGHQAGIYALDVLPSGRHLVSASRDKTVKIWGISQTTCQKTLVGHAAGVLTVAALPEGSLISGSEDKTIKLWDVERGQCLRTLKAHTGRVTQVVIPSTEYGYDKFYVISRADDNTIKLWDLKQLRCVNVLKDYKVDHFSLAWLPEDLFASGIDDKSIRIWDLKTGRCRKIFEGHTDYVHVLTRLPNNHLVSGSYDATIKEWDIEKHECVQTLKGHSSNVRALDVLSPHQLVSGSFDTTLKFWDLQEGRCIQTLEGHTAAVLAFKLVSDNQLASGSHDHTIKLWNFSSSSLSKFIEVSESISIPKLNLPLLDSPPTLPRSTPLPSSDLPASPSSVIPLDLSALSTTITEIVTDSSSSIMPSHHSQMEKKTNVGVENIDPARQIDNSKESSYSMAVLAGKCWDERTEQRFTSQEITKDLKTVQVAPFPQPIPMIAPILEEVADEHQNGATGSQLVSPSKTTMEEGGQRYTP